MSKLDIDYIINVCGKNVVIDCGHISVNFNKGLYFGQEGNIASDSEMETLEIGSKIALLLKQRLKNPVCNICFSDVSKNLKEAESRSLIKNLIRSGEVFDYLPSFYQSKISDLLKSNIRIKFSLQTANSNLFLRVLKKLKKEIRKSHDVKEVYLKHSNHFITDQAENLFGLVSPLVLDSVRENEIMGGDWWQDPSISLHPNDLLQAPLLKLKKTRTIFLFSKTDGTLCPGTYLGQIYQFEPSMDRIAIYSRKDDPAIGEKINQATIAAFHIDPKFSARCFQIVKPVMLPGFELTEISRNDFKDFEYREFNELFLDHQYKEFPVGVF
ncbi:MAG: hypothetical protein P0S95_04925 [Rhabdochlamydiaceae bacterium]|nr:hypothetical protein [Candidatus Amphrikana amoebophyrae]